MTHSIAPLTLEPRVVPTVWGGTRLAAWLGLPESQPERVGEVWQVYDDNVIRGGELAGRTLAEATHVLGERLVGTRSWSRYGADFPLLVKFLDTAAPLSVQVHPDDRYAHEHEAGTGYHGKNEAWYIIDAVPGATVVHGLVRTASREELAAAARDGTLDDLLQRVPVHAGQTIPVPTGTIHTIGPGILLYEVQQKSDLTYRVYDFGRRDPRTGQTRELHLSKALDVADLGPAPRPQPPRQLADGRELLTTCASFAMERWIVHEPATAATDRSSLEILSVIAGGIRLGWTGGAIDLAHGGTAVLPAALGAFDIAPTGSAAATMLRAYVPDPG